MFIYYLLLLFILMNGILAKNNRRWFVYSTFTLIFLIAALRKYTIGIDLELHYAINFERIANLSWAEAIEYPAYDVGLNILCKLFSYISNDRQIFIICTSAIIFYSVARYIYKYAEDVAMETFMFLTMYCYFLYLNIIAQALAFSIFLFAIPYLQKKKYLKYTVIVLLASTVHASAIILVLLVPLSFLPLKRKYVALFSTLVPISLFMLDRLAIMFAEFIPEFNRYLDINNVHGRATGFSSLSLAILTVFSLILIAAWYFLFRTQKENNLYRPVLRNFGIIKRRKYVDVLQLDSNFLAYATIIVIAARLAGTQMEVSARIGYYFYIFSFTLLGRSLLMIRSSQNRRLIKVLIYIMLGLFFLVTGHIFASKSYYGVAPYEFFWN